MNNYKYLPYNAGLTKIARRLRKNMTIPERKLWFQFLKYLPIKFTPQKPILYYIVDFYCPSKFLVIELDGAIHDDLDVKENDLIREENLRDLGLRIIRFKNKDIIENFEEVKETIHKILNE